MTVFQLTVFPAQEGDCLLLSYGQSKDRQSHMLIDGGQRGTWKYLKSALRGIAVAGESLELLVLTHIDADHINGFNKMLDDGCPVLPEAIWYNGYEQLKPLLADREEGPLGFKGADTYSRWLDALGWRANVDFDGRPVCIEEFTQFATPAGLKLILISPTHAKLRCLIEEWSAWRENQNDPGLEVQAADEGFLGVAENARRLQSPQDLDICKLASPCGPDTSIPNGSSIAMIAEYGGRRVLLAADAHADLLTAGLVANAGPNGRCAVDLFKLSHHGSKANLTKEVLENLECTRFVVSTNGSRFGHPDPEAIAKVLKFGSAEEKTIFFNYRSQFTLPWRDETLQAKWNYRSVYPDAENRPIVIAI